MGSSGFIECRQVTIEPVVYHRRFFILHNILSILLVNHTNQGLEIISIIQNLYFNPLFPFKSDT